MLRFITCLNRFCHVPLRTGHILLLCPIELPAAAKVLPAARTLGSSRRAPSTALRCRLRRRDPLRRLGKWGHRLRHRRTKPRDATHDSQHGLLRASPSGLHSSCRGLATAPRQLGTYITIGGQRQVAILTRFVFINFCLSGIFLDAGCPSHGLINNANCALPLVLVSERTKQNETPRPIKRLRVEASLGPPQNRKVSSMRMRRAAFFPLYRTWWGPKRCLNAQAARLGRIRGIMGGVVPDRRCVRAGVSHGTTARIRDLFPRALTATF